MVGEFGQHLRGAHCPGDNGFAPTAAERRPSDTRDAANASIAGSGCPWAAQQMPKFDVSEWMIFCETVREKIILYIKVLISPPFYIMLQKKQLLFSPPSAILR